MSSNPSSTGKSLPPPTSFPAAQPPAVTSPSFESAARSRSGQTGPSLAAPRNNQATRKQHRNQRRPNKPPLDDEITMAEYRAVSNASSRRGQTSITHLLNYSAPRPYQHHHHDHSRSYRRQPTWGPGSGYHAADKAKYIHANYRFVVNPQARYDKQAIDADEHVDWLNVLQVIASNESQSAGCPICLGDPVAPRMAKCGHIFCLPCIIRYMNSATEEEQKSQKKPRWRKCPICDDSIYISDVRPVRFYVGQESSLPRPGEDVILRLMMRHSHSTLALPKEGAEVLNSGEDVPWHFAANVMDYARIMKGTAEYMLEQFDEEIEAIEKQEKEDELMFGEDSEWTQKAVRNINAAKEVARELKPETPSPQAKASANRGKGPMCDYFFYTCPPHVYLSPLDIRILKTKFGDFSQFPTTLLPRVEHISTGHAMDDSLRKRARYLGHLPHGCLLSFIECDWTDIIPAEILKTFKPELERRRKRNREKEAQEERERLQAERLESAEIWNTRRNVSYFEDSEPPIPVLNMDDFQPLAPTTGTATPSGGNGRGGSAEETTVSAGPKTVWGTSIIPGSPSLPAQQPEGQVDDGWLKDDDVWGARDVSLQKNMESLSVEGKSDETARKAGGQKKKKKQKITLMSTGSRRMG